MFPFARAVAARGGEIHGNQSGFGKRNAEQAALSGEQFLNNLVEIWGRRIDHVAQAVEALPLAEVLVDDQLIEKTETNALPPTKNHDLRDDGCAGGESTDSPAPREDAP